MALEKSRDHLESSGTLFATGLDNIASRTQVDVACLQVERLAKLLTPHLLGNAWPTLSIPISISEHGLSMV